MVYDVLDSILVVTTKYLARFRVVQEGSRSFFSHGHKRFFMNHISINKKGSYLEVSICELLSELRISQSHAPLTLPRRGTSESEKGVY